MKFGKITFNEIFDKLNEDKYSFEEGELYMPQNIDINEVRVDTELYYGENRIFDNVTDEEIIPKKIKKMGFVFGFNGQYLMDVYDNLIHYKASVDKNDLLKAYFYYIENDTFIDIDASDLRGDYDPNKTTLNFIEDLPNGLKDLLVLKKTFGITDSISDLKSKYLETRKIEIEGALYDNKIKLGELTTKINECIKLTN